jgi:hypothetical protein
MRHMDRQRRITNNLQRDRHTATTTAVIGIMSLTETHARNPAITA